MLDLQAKLIFPTHAVAKSGPFPPGAKRLSLRAGDGVELVGIHIPAAKKRRPTTLVLAFPGNAWNAQDAAEYLHEVFPEADVVSFFYRGYAPSGGKPSAKALVADSALVYDYAVDLLSPKRVIAVGFSIGTGVAANLTVSRDVDGLILVTPFDSLKAVAQDMYPWAPIAPFFKHEIDAASALEKCDQPVAVLAGERDVLVPPKRTDELRSRIRNLAFDRTIERAGHNDIYARSSFQLAMREAMDAL